jgi:hypothetical protein
VTEPLSGFETSAESVQVRGWVSGFGPFSIVVGSLTSTTVAPAADRTFSATVAVPAGLFTITVTATDAFTQHASASVAGRRTVGSGEDACSCDAGGACTFARSFTRYCYDGAGNLTARLVGVASQACSSLACP